MRIQRRGWFEGRTLHRLLDALKLEDDPSWLPLLKNWCGSEVKKVQCTTLAADRAVGERDTGAGLGELLRDAANTACGGTPQLRRSDGGEDVVERRARAQGGVGFGVVGQVVAADVDGLALDGEQFGDDLALRWR